MSRTTLINRLTREIATLEYALAHEQVPTRPRDKATHTRRVNAIRQRQRAINNLMAGRAAAHDD